MYCVHQGKVCLQVWNPRRESWQYIPIAKWERMSERARSKYIIDR